jgi:flagellar protein FlbD
MIKLARLNGRPFYLNSDLIEHIDATPDTVVTLTSGTKIMVAESAEEVCEKVVAFRRSILGADGLTHEALDPRTAHLDVVHGG